MSNDTEIGLLVSFPDQSESFTLGFEAGQIWNAMEREGLPVIDRGVEAGFPIHTANLEVINRMAASQGYVTEIGNEQDCWTSIRLTKWPTKPKPNLSIVKSDNT